ncbi:hypothetical protein EVAR_87846_1 [Eumeta japonica]|uniref:Uncharacterized protein n=1 Tax=Eumeta variegata TaxID=151549 RepID=A0A4C1YC73_EUMVA|nr:hypothetical protein EVAR_87846_1 [Eumeta japonica]
MELFVYLIGDLARPAATRGGRPRPAGSPRRIRFRRDRFTVSKLSPIPPNPVPIIYVDHEIAGLRGHRRRRRLFTPEELVVLYLSSNRRGRVYRVDRSRWWRSPRRLTVPAEAAHASSSSSERLRDTRSLHAAGASGRRDGAGKLTSVCVYDKKRTTSEGIRRPEPVVPRHNRVQQSGRTALTVGSALELAAASMTGALACALLLLMPDGKAIAAAVDYSRSIVRGRRARASPSYRRVRDSTSTTSESTGEYLTQAELRHRLCASGSTSSVGLWRRGGGGGRRRPAVREGPAWGGLRRGVSEHLVTSPGRFLKGGDRHDRGSGDDTTWDSRGPLFPRKPQ